MLDGQILVVDDIYDWRITISMVLEEVGCSVKGAASARQALEMLVLESFQIAILDVRLDESDEYNGDGLWLMHEINRNYPLMKVIIMTGYSAFDYVGEALRPNQFGKSSAFYFLEKDELDKLVEVVKNAFSQT